MMTVIVMHTSCRSPLVKTLMSIWGLDAIITVKFPYVKCLHGQVDEKPAKCVEKVKVHQ